MVVGSPCMKIFTFGIKNMLQKQKQKNRGFVILFAVLISSLILLISTGVFRVVQKELVLSSAARESQFAFYAADSALECALFWDVSDYSANLGGTPFIQNPAGSQIGSIECNGRVLETRHLAASGGTSEYLTPYVFRYPAFDNQETNACAYVLVEKNKNGGAGGEVRMTAVGFSVCTLGASGYVDTPDFNDPRLLERRMSITYNTLSSTGTENPGDPTSPSSSDPTLPENPAPLADPTESSEG